MAGVVAFLLSAAFVSTGAWSVFDEYTHFDYVTKVGEELRLPQVNDLLGQTAMRAAVCDAAPGFGALAPSCGADILDATRAPYGGTSTATGYLPTYYVITGLGARAIVALPGDLSLLHAARLMGGLYLAITAMLVVGIARRLGASSAVALSFAVLASAAPMVLQQFSTVNNDQLAVTLSLAAVYAYLALRESTARRRYLVAFGLAFLAMTVKETALFGVIAVLALAVRDAAAGPAERRWRALSGAAGLAALVVVAAVALREAVYPAVVGALPDNGLQNAAIDASQGTPPINLVAGNALRGASTVFEVTEGALAGVWFAVAGQLLVLVALGLPLAAVLRVQRRAQWLAPRRVLSVVVILGIPLFIAGFLAILSVSGLPLFFQPRYLLPSMVLALAVAGSFVRPAWWRLTLPVAGLLAATTAVALVIGPEWVG